MIHPGLPWAWAALVLAAATGLALWAAAAPPGKAPAALRSRPLFGWLAAGPLPLSAARLLAVAAFAGTVVAGFLGTQIPRANIATVLTWTVWWTLVVTTVLVVGSGWCAVCPWKTLAGFLVRRRLWGEDDGASSLGLRVPRPLRSVWPALALLVGLTWLELGEGVTLSPAGTSALAVVMVVLATLSLAVFERGAFCRYFCPVGRTLGCYSQLSAVELRPVDQERCDACTTLECYRGTADYEPCPTGLTMGRGMQSTYCLSCGACALACPGGNVAWRLRSPAFEPSTGARPHWDEAWFMVGLMALATFHGLTMLPPWDDAVRWVGRHIGDSTRLTASFSLLMAAGLALPTALYAAAVALCRPPAGAGANLGYRRRFAGLSFAALPLAFTTHVAHNLTHLVREGAALAAVLPDPMGRRMLADPSAVHLRMAPSLLPDQVLFAAQAGLLAGGFWLAMVILRRRGAVLGLSGWRLAPVVAFALAICALDVWVLSHPMMMRM